jgi:hypothetical protein
MKTKAFWLALPALCVSLLLAGTPAFAAESKPAAQSKPAPGLEAAQTISTVTGVAISPLLGVGAVGAYQYYKAPPAQRARLNWYAHPWFWVPALILVVLIGIKDIAGTALPAALKKPFDVLETIENKISGLIAAGAFIPLIVSIFPDAAPAGDQAWSGASGFATINGATIGNALMVPLALCVFVVVWLASHAINILILISPFTLVDTALKAFRLSLLSLVTLTAFTNPYAGAIFSVCIIVVAYFVSGWSLRLTVFGSVYVWDFLTFRRTRFQPAPGANWMFTARKLEQVPIRTYGKLSRDGQGRFCFVYRPWLVLPARTLTLPAGRYAVGRGLFYPELSLLQEDKTRSMLVLPPRFQTHEDALARVYEIGEVRDIGLRKGLSAMWAWMKRLVGGGQQEVVAAAA